MQSYIGDRNEQPFGTASAILPDGRKVIAIARQSTKNGLGIVVLNSTDGINWTTNFKPHNASLAGVVINPTTGVITAINQGVLSSQIVVSSSSDFGATWTTISAPLTGGVTTANTYSVWNCMAYDKFNDRIIITNKNSASLSTLFYPILGSTDGGATWSALYTKPNNGRTVTSNLMTTDGGPYSVIGRITNSTATESELFLCENGNPTYRTVVNPTGLGTIAQASTVGAFAWNPLSRLYLQYAIFNFNTTAYPILDPDTYVTTTPTITGLVSNEVLSAACYNTGSQGFVGSTRSTLTTATVPQTQQRIMKSKYGNGGWLFDPTPDFNTSNIEIWVMLNDPNNNMLYTYTAGNVYDGNGMGYINTSVNMPTPSPTPTPSATPAAATTNDVLTGGTFTSVNAQTGPNRYALLDYLGTSIKSIDMNFSANAAVHAILPVPNTNDVILFGLFTSYLGQAVNSVIRIDRSGTINTEFNFTGVPNNKTILMATYDSNNNVYFTTSTGRVVKMNVNGTVDSTWGSSLTISGTPAIWYDSTINKFYISSDTRIYRVNIDGTQDNTFTPPVTNGATYSIVTQSDGKVVIFGAFNSVSSTSRPFIARLNTDGSLDVSFYYNLSSGAAVTFGGRQLFVDDYGVYVSTTMPNIEGTGRNYLIRLKNDGRIDPTFNVVLNSYPYHISRTEDKKLLIAGTFTNVNGTARNYAAKLNPSDGSLVTSFVPVYVPSDGVRVVRDYDQPVLSLTPTPTPSVTPTPSQMAQIPTNVVYVGNNVTGVNGRAGQNQNFGVLSSSGTTSLNSTVQSVTGSPPYAFVEVGDGTGDLLIFGGGMTLDGVITQSIFRVTSTGTRVTSFTAPTTSQLVSVVAYTSGSFVASVLSGSALIKFDGNGVVDTAWWSTVTKPAVIGSTALAYDSVRGKLYYLSNANTLKAINDDGTLDTVFNGNTNWGASTGNAMRGLGVQPDGKVVTYGAGTSNNFFRANTDGTRDTSFSPTSNGDANISYGGGALKVTRDGIYVAGTFTSISGVSVPGYARLRFSDGNVDPSFTLPTKNGLIYSTSVGPDQRPIVCGTFTTINGATRTAGMARLLYDGSIDTTFTGPTKESGTFYYAAALSS